MPRLIVVGSGAGVSYIGAYTKQSSGTTTFSGCALGDGVAKHVVVAIYAETTAAATVTIAGVTATIYGAGTVHQYAVAETSAATGDIVVSFTATNRWRSIGVFAVYGGLNYVSTAYASHTPSGSGVTTSSSTAAGGTVIAMATDLMANGTGSGSLTNVTEMQTVILPNNAFTSYYWKYGMAVDVAASSSYSVTSTVLSSLGLSLLSFQ